MASDKSTVGIIKTPTNLSIGFHNIGGKHSATHGCKLDNLINLKNDIEVLAEMLSMDLN